MDVGGCLVVCRVGHDEPPLSRRPHQPQRPAKVQRRHQEPQQRQEWKQTLRLIQNTAPGLRTLLLVLGIVWAYCWRPVHTPTAAHAVGRDWRALRDICRRFLRAAAPCELLQTDVAPVRIMSSQKILKSCGTTLRLLTDVPAAHSLVPQTAPATQQRGPVAGGIDRPAETSFEGEAFAADSCAAGPLRHISRDSAAATVEQNRPWLVCSGAAEGAASLYKRRWTPASIAPAACAATGSPGPAAAVPPASLHPRPHRPPTAAATYVTVVGTGSHPYAAVPPTYGHLVSERARQLFTATAGTSAVSVCVSSDTYCRALGRPGVRPRSRFGIAAAFATSEAAQGIRSGRASCCVTPTVKLSPIWEKEPLPWGLFGRQRSCRFRIKESRHGRYSGSSSGRSIQCGGHRRGDSSSSTGGISLYSKLRLLKMVPAEVGPPRKHYSPSEKSRPQRTRTEGSSTRSNTIYDGNSTYGGGCCNYLLRSQAFLFAHQARETPTLGYCAMASTKRHNYSGSPQNSSVLVSCYSRESSRECTCVHDQNRVPRFFNGCVGDIRLCSSTSSSTWSIRGSGSSGGGRHCGSESGSMRSNRTDVRSSNINQESLSALGRGTLTARGNLRLLSPKILMAAAIGRLARRAEGLAAAKTRPPTAAQRAASLAPAALPTGQVTAFCCSKARSSAAGRWNSTAPVVVATAAATSSPAVTASLPLPVAASAAVPANNSSYTKGAYNGKAAVINAATMQAATVNTIEPAALCKDEKRVTCFSSEVTSAAAKRGQEVAEGSLLRAASALHSSTTADAAETAETDEVALSEHGVNSEGPVKRRRKRVPYLHMGEVPTERLAGVVARRRGKMLSACDLRKMHRRPPRQSSGLRSLLETRFRCFNWRAFGPAVAARSVNPSSLEAAETAASHILKSAGASGPSAAAGRLFKDLPAAAPAAALLSDASALRSAAEAIQEQRVRDLAGVAAAADRCDFNVDVGAGGGSATEAAALLAMAQGARAPQQPIPAGGWGRLRVCGGQHAGRRLLMPSQKDAEVRPMMAKVKEALFAMLQQLGAFRGADTGPHASQRRVLDLYSGSGALAIESLSRGAAYALLVDSSLDCCQAAAVNLHHCTMAARSRVIRATVEEVLVSPERYIPGLSRQLWLQQPHCLQKLYLYLEAQKQRTSQNREVKAELLPQMEEEQHQRRPQKGRMIPYSDQHCSAQQQRRRKARLLFLPPVTEHEKAYQTNVVDVENSLSNSQLQETAQEVIRIESEEAPQDAFGLVFACPPYTEVIYEDLIQLLLRCPIVGDDALVVIEYPREIGCLPRLIRDKTSPAALIGLRNRLYGRTCLAVYAKQKLYEICTIDLSLRKKSTHSAFPAASSPITRAQNVTVAGGTASAQNGFLDLPCAGRPLPIQGAARYAFAEKADSTFTSSKVDADLLDMNNCIGDTTSTTQCDKHMSSCTGERAGSVSGLADSRQAGVRWHSDDCTETCRSSYENKGAHFINLLPQTSRWYGRERGNEFVPLFMNKKQLLAGGWLVKRQRETPSDATEGEDAELTFVATSE